MSTQENKTIAKRFVQVWGKGNLDIIEELAAPSLYVNYPIMPQVIHGSKIFKKVIEGFRSAFPDSDIKIEEAIAEDDKVVISWTFSGTHNGSFLGIPATNKNVKWTGITIYRIIEGKIVEEKGEEDMLGFFRQIGLVA
ncbi:MAG: ester cyclase [Pseudomonadota bacterium]